MDQRTMRTPRAMSRAVYRSPLLRPAMRVVRILHENEYQGVRRVFSTRDRARDGNRLAPCTDYVYVAWGRACKGEAPNICQSLNAQASNTQSLLTRLRVQLSSDESLLTRLEDIHHDKHDRLHTSLGQRNYQESAMQREHEKLERAKEILERRKGERDCLSAYMHSVGNPHAKHPDHLRGMRRLSTEGMFGRPPWTASLRSDYETLITLREKEIAVATLRIENYRQKPNKSTEYLEARDIDHTNESDEPYLPNIEEFEFPQDALEPESAENSFDTDHKSIGSSLQNDLEDLKNLENELLAFANKTENYRTNVGADLLLMEPTVFREISFNSLRTGPRLLPPRPPSNPKADTLPRKSCLKSNRDYNQRSLSPLSETPRTFSQSLSERMSFRTLQSTVAATSNMEKAIVPTSNAPQRAKMTKTMTNHFLNRWGNHQDMDYGNDSFNVLFDLDCKEHPCPQAEEEIGMPISVPTVSNVATSKERATATILPDNASSGPNSGRQMESESKNTLSCSGLDTPLQEKPGGISYSPNASHPSDFVQVVTSTCLMLPPRYTSTSKSWQEEKDFDSSIPDECHIPSLQSPQEKYEDKNWASEEESFITWLDSEATTTRLNAEVLAVQSRLEDCKLKPLNFRDILEEPFYLGRGQLEQRGGAEITPAQDSSRMRSPPNGGHGLVDGQNEQGVIEVNMWNHEIFTPMDIVYDYERVHILDIEYREEENTTENAPNGVGASSLDDHAKDVLTTAQCSGDRVDNFTEVPTSEEIESRKKPQRTGWEIPWKAEAEQQRRYVELVACPGSLGSKKYLLAKSATVLSPFSRTITTPSNLEGLTLPIAFRSEKVIPSRGSSGQQLSMKHVIVRTDAGQEHSGHYPHCHSGSAGNSTNSEVLHSSTRAQNTADVSNCSSISKEGISKYQNIGYRDLSEAPRTRHPKYCLYSSQGLLQVGYSQPRQSPQPVKLKLAQNNKQSQAYGFQDSLGNKENYGMSVPDDQELNILASLERLNWKLATISARAMNRTKITPSLISQDQTSIQSAPAATGVKGAFLDKTAGTFPANLIRPSSVSMQTPPTRKFWQRRMVGMKNKF